MVLLHQHAPVLGHADLQPEVFELGVVGGFQLLEASDDGLVFDVALACVVQGKEGPLADNWPALFIYIPFEIERVQGLWSSMLQWSSRTDTPSSSRSLSWTARCLDVMFAS